MARARAFCDRSGLAAIADGEVDDAWEVNVYAFPGEGIPQPTVSEQITGEAERSRRETIAAWKHAPCPVLVVRARG